MNKIATGIAVFAGTILGLFALRGPVQPPTAPAPPVQVRPQLPPVQPQVQPPTKNAISVRVPTFLPYPKVVEQLKTWNREAPAMTEVGTYGKSSKGTDLYYLNICTKTALGPQRQDIRLNNVGQSKPKVLITACIHGNEPLAATTVMGYIGTLLADYGTDPEVTALLDSRDIYFIPVVNPDTLAVARHVDGVDPNRDFPGPYDWNHRSVATVKALADFMQKHRFKAAISGHTYGRVYLTPYGDTKQLCPNQRDFDRVIGKMSQLSGYRIDRACNNYPTVIYGTEVDYYYRHGAFAIVMEFGEHQRVPTDQETRTEFDKTYRAVLHFIKEAPLVDVRPVR